MRALVLAVLASLFPLVAHAQPSVTPPVEPPIPEYYKPTTAVMIGMGASLAAVVGVELIGNIRDRDTRESLAPLAAVVLIAAPSAGHWYSHDVWSRGLATRLAGAAVMAVGINGLSHPNCECDGPSGEAIGTIMVGLGLIGVGSLDDIITAGSTATAANRERWLDRVQVAPSIGSDRAGLVLSGSF
jgi:hypothetical protein